MKLSLIEQETIIRYNRAENQVIIDTYNLFDFREYLKRCMNYPDDFKLLQYFKSSDGDIIGGEFVLSSKKLVTIRNTIPSRKLTEEQRKALSKRMKGVKHDDKTE